MVYQCVPSPLAYNDGSGSGSGEFTCVWHYAWAYRGDRSYCGYWGRANGYGYKMVLFLEGA